MHLANKRVLLVNDDGIDAPGLTILETAVCQHTRNYCVVAPVTNQSGRARATSYGETVRLHRLEENRYTVSGTPADCVLVSLTALGQGCPFDLVISGVNNGANVADDVGASGTIGACLQAASLDVPGLAISQHWPPDKTPNWYAAETLLADLLPGLADVLDTDRAVLNVNLPVLHPGDAVAGTAVVRSGYRVGPVNLEEVQDEGKDRTFVISDLRADIPNEAGCDLDLVNKGFIVVTPLTLDQTDYDALETVGQDLRLLGQHSSR